MTLSRLENGTVTKTEASASFDMLCDVLCVGAGSAGIYAADAAAREGAEVILLENGDTIGGMHILGRVFGCYYGAPGGSFEQDGYTDKDPKFNKTTYRIDKKQLAEYDRLAGSGVKLLCRHTPTGVILDGDRVMGLTVFDGMRELSIGAKLVIDSTSDGHLIRMLDVEKRYGRESDGNMAPFSVFSNYVKDGKVLQVNEDAGHINQYDSADFSEKAMLAHRDMTEVLDRGEFIHLATRTGVREGLSYEGESCFSYRDVILSRIPERVLFWAYSDIDRHGHDMAADEELMQNFSMISNLSTVTIRIPVPMGCVVPRGIRGIVTAGRCFSADTYMLGTVRMNRDMFRMGECVGIAAAMAIISDKDFLDIDYDEFVRKARSYGCYDGDVNKSFGFDFPRKDKPYLPLVLDVWKNLPLLKTEAPGAAVWNCYLNKEDKRLAEWLRREHDTADGELYRYNLAIALGVMDDRYALATLRDIVRNRDCFYFKDCRRTNRFRSAVAICLLGRLGDKSDIPLLERLVFSEEEYLNPIYHTLKPDYLYYNGKKKNFLYFDIFTQALAALVKIYDRERIDKSELAKGTEALLTEGVAVRRIAPDCEPHEAPYAETVSFLGHMIAEMG